MSLCRLLSICRTSHAFPCHLNLNSQLIAIQLIYHRSVYTNTCLIQKLLDTKGVTRLRSLTKTRAARPQPSVTIFGAGGFTAAKSQATNSSSAGVTFSASVGNERKPKELCQKASCMYGTIDCNICVAILDLLHLTAGSSLKSAMTFCDHRKVAQNTKSITERASRSSTFQGGQLRNPP